MIEIKVCNECSEAKKLNKDNFRWRKDRQKYYETCKKCCAIPSIVGPNTTRVCSKCGIEKTLCKENFRWRIDTRAYRPDCNECRDENYTKYKKKNPEKIRALQKKSAAKLENKAREKERKAKYKKENPEKVALQQKERDKRHRDNGKRAIWEAKRRSKDKIKRYISRIINLELKKHKSSKGNQSCWKYLQYTPIHLVEQFQILFSHPDNLTSDGKVWMTWENHGKYVPQTWNDNDPSTFRWHIDHIIPRSKLTYAHMSDVNFIIAEGLQNLRPLSAKQNVSEQDNRTDEEIAHIKANIAAFLFSKSG